MYTLRMFLALAASLLILAACAGRPTTNTTSMPAAPVEDANMSDATIETASTGDSMNDMSDDTAAMDDMVADAEHTDMMDDDTDQMDDMSDDSATMNDMAADAEHTEMMDNDADQKKDMSDDTAAMDDMAGAEVMGHEMAAERPAWQQIALTDARTGQQFTLADYADNTVFVEPFATWCSNCRRQLGNVQTAYSTLGDDAVFIALSVEPNISNDELVDYANNQGFEYIFAAMPPEMLQELSALFGQTIANPPATPHFIIRPDGSTTDLVTGFEEPDVLVEQLQSTAG